MGSKLEAFFAGITGRFTENDSETTPPMVLEAQSARAAAGVGGYAREWMKDLYTEVHFAFISQELETVHRRLLSGEISGESYRELYQALRRVKESAQAAIDRGAQAESDLAEWGKNGTLAEVDEWIAANGSILGGGV